MNELNILGKWLLTIGVLLTASGGLLLLASRFFRGRLLPGAILLQKGNFTVCFPIVTCLVVSVTLTLILQLARWFRR